MMMVTRARRVEGRERERDSEDASELPKPRVKGDYRLWEFRVDRA